MSETATADTRTVVTIRTASGRTKRLPKDLYEPEKVAGLDPEGRIVMDWYDARTREPSVIAGYTVQPSMFGLTLCCNASDKGVEDGVVCRGCYGMEETGSYLFREPDGSFPGLDPITSVRTTTTEKVTR